MMITNKEKYQPKIFWKARSFLFMVDTFYMYIEPIFGYNYFGV